MSGLFVENLVRHELQSSDRRLALGQLGETVGYAKLTVGQGSLASSVFTLVASAMGAGCLSLPHMFRQSGLAFGLLLLLCGAVLAHISLVVLMSCARYTHCKSFAELVALSHYDNTGHMQLVVDSVIAFYGCGAVLIYMMLIGDFLGGIAQAPLIVDFLGTGVSRGPLILGSLAVVLPLSLPSRISALRYVCILSTGSVAFMTLVVLAKTPGFVLEREAAAAKAGEAPEGLCWFAGDFRSTLQSFAIAVFAFAAHTNAVPTVVVLEEPTAARIWKVSLLSILVEFAIYAVLATSGYLSFLSGTRQDFIRNYPVDDIQMLVVRCVYTVPVVFGVPINLSPAAGSLQRLAQKVLPECVKTSLGEGACCFDGTNGEWVLHAAIVTLVLGFCATLGICSEEVADVIGLLGSFFGTLICLWWPHKIYQSVLGKLHARRLAITVRCALFVAAGIGVLAFFVQASEVFRQWLAPALR